MFLTLVYTVENPAYEEGKAAFLFNIFCASVPFSLMIVGRFNMSLNPAYSTVHQQ